MAEAGHVSFVGAGPGAADLLTLRAARAIADAEVVVWAASLVQEAAVSEHARADAELVDSKSLTLEDLDALYARAAAEALRVARVHSGDPSLWSAVGEQVERVEAHGLAWDIVPGVGALSAAAAAAGVELTVPGIAQSVILTRMATATPMPPGEDVRAFAAHGTTMALYLSAKRAARLEAELLAGGYPPETPCVIASQVTWPDELVLRCHLDELAATLRSHRLIRHTLVLVGPGVARPEGAASAHGRSSLYDPGFAHVHRTGRTPPGEEEAP